MSFTFTKIILTFKLQQALDQSYFPGMRNQFDGAFRRVINCSNATCQGCRSSVKCCYPQLFSQSLSADPQALKRYQKPSLPFILQFPSVSALYRGTRVELCLVLVGIATEFPEQFIQAVLTVVEGSLAFLRAESVDYLGNRYLLLSAGGAFDSSSIFIFSSAELQKSCIQLGGAISINILTPIRIMQQGRALHDLTFSNFIRSLFRRISSLAYYYEGVELNYDFKWLAEKSTSIRSINSTFAWTEWPGPPGTVKISGVTGKAEFVGDLDEFHIFLLLGEYLNIGKGSTFGLGRYVLVRPN